MECFAQAGHQYFGGLTLPAELSYPGLCGASEVSGYSSFEFAKMHIPLQSYGGNDACAEVETNAPSDSDGSFEDEDGLVGQLPPGLRGPGAMEPLWLPLPSGLDAGLLPQTPTWEPTEPAVLAALPAPYSPSPGGWRAPLTAPQRPPVLPIAFGCNTPPPPPREPPSASTPTTPGALKSGLRVQPGLERTKVSWTLDAKKLASKDQVIVSQRFDLHLGHEPVPFKMMLCPKTVSDRRGGHCFKKAKGVGSVQLKCEAGAGGPQPMHLAFKIAVGREPARGPVAHDFAAEGVAGLPEDQRHWDLARAVDQDSRTLTVELEVSHVD